MSNDGHFHAAKCTSTNVSLADLFNYSTFDIVSILCLYLMLFFLKFPFILFFPIKFLINISFFHDNFSFLYVTQTFYMTLIVHICKLYSNEHFWLFWCAFLAYLQLSFEWEQFCVKAASKGFSWKDYSFLFLVFAKVANCAACRQLLAKAICRVATRHIAICRVATWHTAALGTIFQLYLVKRPFWISCEGGFREIDFDSEVWDL